MLSAYYSCGGIKIVILVALYKRPLRVWLSDSILFFCKVQTLDTPMQSRCRPNVSVCFVQHYNKKLITRWDSERKLSFLSRHRTRSTKYNRLMHQFRHKSTRLCVRTQVYQIQWNNAMQRRLRRSRSFKVTDFGTNRKLIYDFLLVINTNLPPILHRFQVMADYSSNFR